MPHQKFKNNNFDLLRLIAAIQVVLWHSTEILHIPLSDTTRYLLNFTHLFPGVPIFFFISGLLISKSFESNHNLPEYIQNRMLRLYPGLIVCVLFSFILIFASGYIYHTNASALDIGLLFIAKTTFLQFYNPDFMRGYGDGVLNGSLWTITVELQFYILVPFLYTIFKLMNDDKSNFKLVMLIILFLLVNRIYAYIPDEHHNDVWYKLLRVSFLPWFYMFLCGVYFQKNFELFFKLLAGKFVLLIILYSVIGFFVKSYNIGLGNNINPLVFICLICVIFSFAYSFTGLSKALLKGNDISYGTYIYHMPIVNFMLYNELSGNIIYAIYVFILTMGLAWISWILIEKRSLTLKKHPLNPLRRVTTLDQD